MGHQNPVLPVQPGAVDTHCHLFLLDREPREVVEAARASGVDRILCVGIDPATSRRSLELADALEGVFATAGMHPHDASTLDGAAGARIEELLGDPRVLAVGETGLDFFRMRSPREEQERAFGIHVAWSLDAGKPLVVHVRDAWPEILRLLDEGSAERVVLHCFSGDAAIARECAARGYYVSFAGNVTYPKNEHLREAAAAVPFDRLLVETDSPFLSPTSRRGRDNEPANIVETIETVARVRGETFERTRDLTAANARAAFPGLR
ncbi:MAG TPA: TatD family hydrolase [Actinomycetota bacterium]|jgi:TatD DNase family protein